MASEGRFDDRLETASTRRGVLVQFSSIGGRVEGFSEVRAAEVFSFDTAVASGAERNEQTKRWAAETEVRTSLSKG